MNAETVADDLSAKLRSTRCCDALEPCPDCLSRRAAVQRLRRMARLDTLDRAYGATVVRLPRAQRPAASA